jgi:hypothetical protein
VLLLLLLHHMNAYQQGRNHPSQTRKKTPNPSLGTGTRVAGFPKVLRQFLLIIIMGLEILGKRIKTINW